MDITEFYMSLCKLSWCIFFWFLFFIPSKKIIIMKKVYNCNKCWTDHKKITIVIFMIAESSILIILDSYIFSCSKAVIIIMIITKYLFFWIIRTLMIAYKLTKKIFQSCLYQSEISKIIFTGCQFSIPK